MYNIRGEENFLRNTYVFIVYGNAITTYTWCIYIL